jgi:molybdopterin converting factor small subunit
MKEMAQRARHAAERILEDERLTDNLEDDAARVLIEWGIAIAESIARSEDDLEAVNDRLKATRRLMRYVNKWVPRRTEKDAQGYQEVLSKLLKQAAIAYGEHTPPPASPETQEALIADFTAPATPATQAVETLRAFIEKSYANSEDRTTRRPSSTFTVQVKLFATLRRYYPHLGIGEPMPVELQENATVAKLVIQLKLPDNQVKVVFVNGIVREGNYMLKDGDQVGIFPPVGGG